MPLFGAEPKIDQYRKCVNQFWRKTAEQGAGTTAFVQIESDYGIMSYLSCLKLLKQNLELLLNNINLPSLVVHTEPDFMFHPSHGNMQEIYVLKT